MPRRRAARPITILAVTAALVGGLAACDGDPAPVATPTPADSPTEEAVAEPGLIGVYELDIDRVDIDVVVTILTDAFRPEEVEVVVGDRIVWENRSDLPHSVAFADEEASPTVASGDAIARIFDEPGTYRYVCGIHPFMDGTVVVDE